MTDILPLILSIKKDGDSSQSTIKMFEKIDYKTCWCISADCMLGYCMNEDMNKSLLSNVLSDLAYEYGQTSETNHRSKRVIGSTIEELV